MKKNMMLRTASVLLIAVLMSTCAISGTFAKYVTSDSATDTARVAKFGVSVTGTGEDAFVQEYKTDDGIYSGVITNSVVGDEDVIAPGTKGEFADIKITGTPEVAVKVTYDATVELNGKWLDDTNAYYCPIIITVKGTSYLETIDGKACTDEADFIAKVTKAIEDYTQVYAPGTNLDNSDELVVTWEWPFSTSDANDVKDTDLGDKAAAGEAATISITVVTTVTQIN